MNIIRQTYSHYEVGRCTPTVRTLYRLSQLYDVPIESFADKLGHTTTYMGKEDELSCEEEMLLLYFKELDEKEQNFLLTFLRDYKKNKKGNTRSGL